MMGIFGQASSALRGRPRGASVEDKAIEDSEPDDTSVLDEQEGSIISSLISQLRIGMDLHRVTFPTFVLEPRSMLERIADFMSHPELIFGAEELDDPEERFLVVLRYYLSGWHIKPKGVKKPYNPVLGEFFRCRYDYPNSTQGFYISEQVSHHPPISAYFYISPANKIRIIGEIKPKSKFLGNSVSTIMEGENRMMLLGRPEDGEYVVTMPNMYARGILFGKMVFELGDTCVAKNEKTGMSCDLDFKTKGFFSGTYNTISGRVRHNGQEIGEVSGRWSHAMEFKSSKTGQKRILFDADSEVGKRVAEKIVPPESEQEPTESRRQWVKLTEAILAKNMDAATDAKCAVEDAQREDRRVRDEKGEKFVPRFFELKDGRWEPKIQLPSDLEEATKAVIEWIWPSSKSEPEPEAQLQSSESSSSS
ncbi:oxysterol-binding protein family [Fomitiporia mediterranea MF3/22]|uniref:oxysterol-binding protein family n=1 Tax=Fomitiporia mediterranea (strain MF3/22) TaxID=694068 RepID=UPI0004408FD9|nr:oxysterol-binding protein family [Fomitiporia mediterranea MF3/22]EJD04489.1 oxysterol-binding protein family [Fomitiporia mediterranea MF3/22]